MKSRKSIWVLISGLIACLALVAAACGSDSDDDDVATATTTATTAAPAATAATEPDPTPRVTEPIEPEPVPGFDGETIELGFLTDLSGPLAIIGAPIRDGAQVYWDYVNNELGGIGGRYRVELVVEDTQDMPGVAVQGYNKIKDDVVLFAEVLSTPPTAAVLEQIKADGILAVPGSLAGQWVGEANLIPNGAPYEYEVINIVDWYFNERGTAEDVYCLIQVDDLYGDTIGRGFNHIAEERGLNLGATGVKINRGQTSFVAELTELEEAGCTVVAAGTVPSEQRAILSEASGMGYTPVWLGALPAYLSLLAAGPGAADLYDNFFVALDAPSLSDSDNPGIANYLARYAEYGSGSPSTFALTGYFQSFAVHTLLERAVNAGDLSREGLMAVYADLGEVSVEGLAGANFVYGEPDERIPPRASRIFEHDPSATPDFLSELAIYESDTIDNFELF